jgi:hypothetical protein
MDQHPQHTDSMLQIESKQFSFVTESLRKIRTSKEFCSTRATKMFAPEDPLHIRRFPRCSHLDDKGRIKPNPFFWITSRIRDDARRTDAIVHSLMNVPVNPQLGLARFHHIVEI